MSEPHKANTPPANPPWKLPAWVNSIATILAIVVPLLAIAGYVANGFKEDIVNEFREEASIIRVEFLADVQERYDDLGFKIETLSSNGKLVPDYLKQKRITLQRRMYKLERVQ